MALTLLDMSRIRKDEFTGGVYEVWAQECDILKKIPIETINTVETKARRTNSIGTVGFRKRGEAYGAIQKGGHDIVADAVYDMGGNIDIDKQDVMDKKLSENPITMTVREGVKAMGWKYNETFINGDHGVDEDEFEGIKVRMANLPSAQVVYGNSSSAELDVATAIAANTTATFQTFLDAIDSATYAVDGHRADVCLTNADGIRAIKAALRRLNLYKNADPLTPVVKGSNERRTSATPSGKPVFNYDGVAYYDVGLDHSQSNPIIGTHTVNSVACRSFYFLKLGKPYLHGIQQYAMQVTKPKVLDDNVTYRVTIDWPTGLHLIHPKSMSELRGVKVS